MATIIENASLTDLNTMHLPASARRLVTFYSEADLAALPDLRADSPVILGGGSNTLFTRPFIDSPVIRSGMKLIEVMPMPDGSVQVRAGSGVALDDLVALTTSWGLWGLENLSLIPGTLGGAAVQNVGAYGVELSSVLVSVDAFDRHSFSMAHMEADTLHLGYRHSIFKEQPGRWIVTSVTLRLQRVKEPELGYKGLAELLEGVEEITPQAVRDAVIAVRRAKLPDPSKIGSCGSYFVNPVVAGAAGDRFVALHPDAPAYHTLGGGMKLSAAWLIDHSGCKDMRCGGAALWPTQPLVLVNASGEATAIDILALEDAVRRRVLDRFGVELRCEVVKV